MKNLFKTIASGLYFNKMKNIELPTENVDRRRLTVDEIKEYVVEEFEKAKDVEKEKVEQKHWGDAELAKEIEWIEALDLKEFFNRKKVK